MNSGDRRKFKRYEMTVFVPASFTSDAFEVTGCLENASQNGVELDINLISVDEIDRLREIVASKQRVIASITLPDDFTIKAGCEIVRGTLLEDKRLFKIGLQILELDLRQCDRWHSFVEKLSQKNHFDINL